MIVCKFGGSSLADADQFRKVYHIVKSDPRRRFIVPSAPGKRHDGDEKVTDLFYACYEACEDGRFDGEKTDGYLSERLSRARNAVIPGFYGSTPGGTVKTFPRGGSDITGALVARAAGAEIYENWTDVDGYLTADPRVVENPRSIPAMTFHHLRELGYAGAAVLHEDAVRPVREKGIPIHIRNTNRPEHPGTRILPRLTKEKPGLVGVGGRDGFAAVTLERDRLRREPAFFGTFSAMLERDGAIPELLPCGIDSVTAVFPCRGLRHSPRALAEKWKSDLDADAAFVTDGLALVSLVAGDLSGAPRFRAAALAALADKEIPVLLMEESADGIHLILGVPSEKLSTAVRTLHRALFEA